MVAIQPSTYCTFPTPPTHDFRPPSLAVSTGSFPKTYNYIQINYFITLINPPKLQHLSMHNDLVFIISQNEHMEVLVSIHSCRVRKLRFLWPYLGFYQAETC